ncbi:hypothetical protein B566_EDAN008684 [Ephemera danica]|nr:hypothetical protein B566_EDAN008684 [Ephemera danica]
MCYVRLSIREFLCAEAMYHLRVPTSRVAAIIAGGESVVRDPLYQGQPIAERTAVVLRLAPTWFRIGSLEIHAHLGEVESLRLLVRQVIATLFSNEEWSNSSTFPAGEQYVQMGVRIANLCYDTWVHWQRVGFTHGVLNSDNISLLGITIDYGPFGFLSTYNPRYVPNNSDSEGRYSYERQLDMLHFDLDKLRSSLEVLIAADVSPGEQRGLLLQRMAREFTAARARAEDELQRVFMAKLGLKGATSDNLPAMLLLAMEETGADFTATFRQLGEVDSNRLGDKFEVKKHWSLNRVASSDLWPSFVERYMAALQSEGVSETDRRDVMNRENPCYVLRNWMAQAAIEKAEKGDFSEVRRLERILRDPYTRQTEAEHLGYGAPPPDWERQLRVSCSS